MNEKIKILIVEDELLIASHLKIILEKLGYDPYEPIGTKEEAIAFLKLNQPDLAILDINLHGNHDGIDIGSHISANFHFPFIYLTSNSDKTTVNNAKVTGPQSFLVKPFTEGDIFAAIEVALCSKQNQPDNELNEKSENDKLSVLSNAIFVRQNNKLVKVNINDITHIQVTDKYIDLFTVNGGRSTVRSSMDAILDSFSEYCFIRTHRSYAVNLSYLEEIKGDSLMVNNFSVPIGRSYKEELVKLISLI